jgi:hypothetical protein
MATDKEDKTKIANLEADHAITKWKLESLIAYLQKGGIIPPL